MNFEFDFTVGKLAACVQNKDIDAWFNALSLHLPEFDINTVSRVAGFVSQCQHESSNFKILEENLNYSSKGLMNTWPKRFTSVADQYARKPEMIANRAYCDRMGNGPESSGDGWKYRGRGILQLTGKDNYANCSQTLFGDDRLVQDPDMLLQPEFAVLSACWFWAKNNLNPICDAGDVKLLTKRINGGDLGLAERIENWNHCVQVFDGDGLYTNQLRTLKLGDSGDDVKRMQQTLGIMADGNFGQGTENAVRNFQQQNNLLADGVAGPSTLAILYSTN